MCVCVVGFLNISILILNKAVPNLIIKSIKLGFSIRNILFSIFIVHFLIEIVYLLFKKQILIGLLKAIGIQNLLLLIL